ncbi:hypothetical protein [Belliella pelovolcani]|uniref:hypothetical protein n=1 Tax=Belliella pelovolcani TaxID=529505 RepID=UPI00391A0569
MSLPKSIEEIPSWVIVNTLRCPVESQISIVAKLLQHLSREQQSQALSMSGVVGRSESFVCGHPPNQTYLNEGTWHCQKCGGKWDSIANK